MEKVHEKTSELINDVRKKKKAFCNKNDHEKGENKVNYEVPYLKHNCCCYCTKVFIAPKYLLKHIFRRHPERILHHHRKLSLTDLEIDNMKQCVNLVSFLDGEFGYLKKELDCVKQILIRSHPSYSLGELKYNSFTSCTDEIDFKKHAQDLNLKESEKIETDKKSYEVNELKLKFVDTENRVQNLQKKFNELFQLVEGNVTSREDICMKISLTEEKLLKQQEAEFYKLRNNMSTQLQNLQTVFLSQLQESNVHWRKEFCEVKNELARLDALTNLNAKKIDSADYLEGLEKKFENRIMQILSSPKIFREKHKLSHSKQEVCANSSLLIGPIKESKNNKGREILCRDDQPDFIISEFSSPDQMKSTLEQKLRYFNIGPEIDRLSSTEFEEKMKLVHSELKGLCKVHKNFMNIRDEINSYAEKVALSKLKQKRHKKIRFSEQGVSGVNTVMEIRNEVCEKSNHFSPKVESTGFLMSSFDGGGDCSAHAADIDLNINQKLSCSHATEIDMNAKKVLEASDSEASKNYSCDDKMPNCSTPKSTKDNQNSNLLCNSTSSEVTRKIYENWDDKSDLESLSSWDDQNSLET